jgi:AcrR family transcriptional regulator
MCIITRLPKRVDHAVRRREITDAVCRITVKGGLAAATFREVAAEAGVSVRLVQYYFGSKDQLLLVTQQHVAERATARLQARLAAAGSAPRDRLRAVLTSFIPDDEESRESTLMFVALHTAALVDPALARPEARAVPHALQTTVARLLRGTNLRPGVEPKREAALLVAALPSLAQTVRDGMQTGSQATAGIAYALDRARR